MTGFLLASSDEIPQCPLPIHGKPENRSRWAVWEAFSEIHIFRDKYEQKILPLNPRQRRCVQTDIDWPEVGDEMVIANAVAAGSWGEPVDETAVAAANAGLITVTPTSPCFEPYSVSYYKSQLSSENFKAYGMETFVDGRTSSLTLRHT